MSPRSRHLLPVGLLCAALATPLGAEQVQRVEEVEVTVGGRTVRALCTPGPRQVLLLHGEVGGAGSWRAVLERSSGEFGACAYERGASGATEGLGGERGWFELLDELRRVHVALGFESGYVLVGHGIGGLYARLYAVDRPRDVGGLVLVDPVHEDMPREARPGMPRAAWSRWMAERERPNADGVREADLARRARGTRLPDIPVTVITATEREVGNGLGWNERFLSEAARTVHASILRGVRTGRHLPATGSGHQVHVEAHELVAREISRMVGMTSRQQR